MLKWNSLWKKDSVPVGLDQDASLLKREYEVKPHQTLRSVISSVLKMFC